MTNKEWLDYLAQNAPDELAAWFDAERTESPTSETMQHIGQVIENTVKRGVYGDTSAQNADSRDKIESDAERYIEHAADYAYEDTLWADETFTLYDAIIELLDRQRAIDDSICDECSSDYYEMQEEHDQMIDGIAKIMLLKQPYTFDYDKPLENIETIGRYIDELTAERDELQERLNRTTSAMNRAAGKWAKTDAELRNALDIMRIWISDDAHLGESAISYEFEKAEGLRKLESIKQAITVTIGGLEAERDNWKEHSRTIEHRCKKAETDCEIYRKKFGKCLDYADAIHALMDDEGMA